MLRKREWQQKKTVHGAGTEKKTCTYRSQKKNSLPAVNHPPPKKKLNGRPLTVLATSNGRSVIQQNVNEHCPPPKKN